MPRKRTEDKSHVVLLVSTDTRLATRLAELLPHHEGWRHYQALTGFDAGVLHARDRPAIVVVDLAMGRDIALGIARAFRQDPANASAVLIALSSEDEANLTEVFLAVFKRPFDLATLAEEIRVATKGGGA